ncbi:MAG: hypothetical protein V7K67_33125 [Nostoc sp.]|uniref:hypothetical protein n=1 Tax=Nostoc sp. TaxID=1180 RepID=UPI002FFAA544
MNSNEALHELEVFRQLLSAISNLRTGKYQSEAVASILASKMQITDVIYEATTIDYLRSKVNLIELLIQLALYLPDYESSSAIGRILDIGRELFNDEWIKYLARYAVILPQEKLGYFFI